jgi:hypothetical protein
MDNSNDDAANSVPNIAILNFNGSDKTYSSGVKN